MRKLITALLTIVSLTTFAQVGNTYQIGGVGDEQGGDTLAYYYFANRDSNGRAGLLIHNVKDSLWITLNDTARMFSNVPFEISGQLLQDSIFADSISTDALRSERVYIGNLLNTGVVGGNGTGKLVKAYCVKSVTWSHADSLLTDSLLDVCCNYFITDKDVLLIPADSGSFAAGGYYRANRSGTIDWEVIQYSFEDSLITYRADKNGNEVYCSVLFNTFTNLTVHDMFCWDNPSAANVTVRDAVFECASATLINVEIEGFNPGLGVFRVIETGAISITNSKLVGFSGDTILIDNCNFSQNTFIGALSCTITTIRDFVGNQVYDESFIIATDTADVGGNFLTGFSSIRASDSTRINGAFLTNGSNAIVTNRQVLSNAELSASNVTGSCISGTNVYSSTDVRAVYANIIIDSLANLGRIDVHGKSGSQTITVAGYGDANISGSMVNSQNVVCNGGTFVDMIIDPISSLDTLFLDSDSITSTSTIVGEFQMYDGTQAAGYLMQSDAYGNASWVSIYAYGEMGFGDSAAVVAVTQNVWEVVTNGNEDLWAVGAIDLDQVTYTNDSLVISRAGTYTIQAQASVTMSSNSRVKLGVYKNGSLLCTCVLPVHVDNGKYSIASYLDVAELAFGDVLQVVIMNETDSNPITFKGGKIVIDYKGT